MPIITTSIEDCTKTSRQHCKMKKIKYIMSKKGRKKVAFFSDMVVVNNLGHPRGPVDIVLDLVREFGKFAGYVPKNQVSGFDLVYLLSPIYDYLFPFFCLLQLD